MERTLTDRMTQKTWSIRQNGQQIETSRNGGKTQLKTFDTPEAAAKHAQKEMWSRLKKGFILHNPHAEAGQPVLHRYIGGGYTGFMPLAPIAGTNSFYCSYVIGQFEKEEIYLLDAQGEKQLACDLPGTHLIMEMQYCTQQQTLLLNLDHQIAGFVPGHEGLKRYTSAMKLPASTLSVSGNLALWYDQGSLVVYDLAAETVRYSKEVECEMYNGHTLQLCAALSHGGGLMAYCAQSGELRVVDIEARQERTILKEKQSLTSGLSFSPDNRLLLSQEQYGSWSLDCYELSSLTRLPNRLPENVKSYAIHEDGSLLAVYCYGRIELYDLHTLQPRLSFAVEHVVKNCSLAFTENYLAVYTDYGCVSLHALS